MTQIQPLIINRRGSNVSITTLDKSPTHFQAIVQKMEIAEKSESDSDHADFNEKAALMTNDKPKEEEIRTRKKSLSWKNVENCKGDDDITAASSLLPENSMSDRIGVC